MWQRLFFSSLAATSARNIFMTIIAVLIVLVVMLCAGIVFLAIQF